MFRVKTPAYSRRLDGRYQGGESTPKMMWYFALLKITWCLKKLESIKLKKGHLAIMWQLRLDKLPKVLPSKFPEQLAQVEDEDAQVVDSGVAFEFLASPLVM
eukprot:Pompholyxophrys_punicea_v1_NODE_967_length_1086_cov_2.670223.p2 type:complete len:102 gc:universal NODE_967_length_1086_cov_2.670223:117-422(+)